MKTIGLLHVVSIGLLFVGLMLLAQEPAKKPATINANDIIDASGVKHNLYLSAPPVEPAKKPATIEELQSQVTQLQQQIAQKDQQIAAMQASITASQKMFGACFQNLADAEQRAAKK